MTTQLKYFEFCLDQLGSSTLAYVMASDASKIVFFAEMTAAQNRMFKAAQELAAYVQSAEPETPQEVAAHMDAVAARMAAVAAADLEADIRAEGRARMGRG